MPFSDNGLSSSIYYSSPLSPTPPSTVRPHTLPIPSSPSPFTLVLPPPRLPAPIRYTAYNTNTTDGRPTFNYVLWNLWMFYKDMERRTGRGSNLAWYGGMGSQRYTHKLLALSLLR